MQLTRYEDPPLGGGCLPEGVEEVVVDDFWVELVEVEVETGVGE